MGIEEWIFRILGALVILNIFSYGIYLVIRGNYQRKRLGKMHKVTGYMAPPIRRINPSLQWYWQGQLFMTNSFHLIVLNRRETVPLRVTGSGIGSELDVWSHNGKGLIVAGIFACLLAIFLMIVLI